VANTRPRVPQGRVYVQAGEGVSARVMPRVQHGQRRDKRGDI